MGRLALCLGFLLLGGCGPLVGGNLTDLSGQQGGGDGAGGMGDGASGNDDLAGQPPRDMAMPPDLTDPNSMPINWSLWNNIKDVDRIACDDAMVGVTEIVFTAVEMANNTPTMTTVPCPAGKMFDQVRIKLSNSTGTFSLTGATKGMVMSTSMPVICEPTDSVEVKIYMF